MAKWILSNLKDYHRSHTEHHNELRKYIRSGRCHRTDDEKDELLNEFNKYDRRFLAANNLQARVDFARKWLRHGLALGTGKRCFLVTFAPKQYVLSFGEVLEFDLCKLRACTEAALFRLDYIGNIEIACYTNIQNDEKYLYALHTHAFVVDADPDELRKRINRLDIRYNAILPKARSAHQVEITSGDEEAVLLYMMKAPAFEYRVHFEKADVFDPFTGEIVALATGRSRQFKYEARRHVQLTIRAATAGWYLDKLIFAGGRGREVRDALRWEARHLLPRRMRRLRQHEYGGYWNPTYGEL